MMPTLLKHLFWLWHHLSPSAKVLNALEVSPPLLTDWVPPHPPV